VLLSLGGSLEALGESIDGVPISQCEYQMDLVHRTMVVRIAATSHLNNTFADYRAKVSVRNEPPDKLQGTLIKHVLIGDEGHAQVSRRFHAELAPELPDTQQTTAS